jgi:hypothetical protein
MIAALQLSQCVVFHGFLRIEGFVYLRLPETTPPDLAAADIKIAVRFDGVDAPPQTCRFVRIHDNGAYEMALDALIDRALFPQSGQLVISYPGSELVKPLTVVIEEALEVNRRNALTWDCLRPAIASISASGRRPRLLDLGGRKRSGGGYTDDLTMCDVTVFDILADPGVDVVGDAHELSQHFPAGHFDLVMCNSVFEHLLMPWKVALELNKILAVGGLCYIHTHQSIGLHDMPWDFWRYSDTSWNGLFNARTGFEIVTARMSYFNHIVTAGWTEAYTGSEASGGFEASGVLVRKVGPTDLVWPVRLDEAIASAYPK